MSRTGNASIAIPAKVEVTVSKSNLVTVKGPNGQLTQQLDPDMSLTIDEGVIKVSRPTEQKDTKPYMVCLDHWLTIWSLVSLKDIPKN